MKGAFCDFHGSLRLLSSSHLREGDKILLIAVLCLGVRNGFFLGKAKKENVPYRVCVEKMVMVICSGGVLSPTSCMFGEFLNMLFLCFWMVANGLAVCFGMVGCRFSWHLSGAYPVDWAGSGFLLSIGMLTI